MNKASSDAEAIFTAALERQSPKDRERFLELASGGDPELRARVERLVHAHEMASGFMNVPAMPAPDTPDTFREPLATSGYEPVSERAGTVIGPYKLLEQIGEGGFGVVFMAEQSQPVRRKVALKVLKPGMDTRQVIARFEAERQALAVMDHPNIARVLDGGATDAGRPYFVMDLVRGVPITTYCDENNLRLPERLELFTSICEAIQHAHTKGIIHRDVKPTNVLVTRHDGQAVVKVIDFGISKAMGQQLTEKTLFTEFAQMIGTPLYMSPEQAELSGTDIDTRSDIYSLGVLLYELLTGTTPVSQEELKKATFDEVRRIIREEEPPKPSTRISTAEAAPSIAAQRHTEPTKLARMVRGELDWIVMKALEKDRSRRYETASALATDVRRYLHNEHVHACPPSTWYRLRKLVQRYRAPALAASLLMLALVGGIIGTTWGLIRANQARTDALREAGQKEEALKDKQAALAQAEDRLWLSLLDQARAQRYSGQAGQRLESLDALAKAARIHPDDKLRDEAIAAMTLPDVRLGPTWDGWPTGHCSWNVDAAYQVYARVSDNGAISVRSIRDDREIQSLPCSPIHPSAVRFSPDHRYLARFGDNSSLQVWRVADKRAMLADELAQASCLAFSSDSRQMAVGREGWVLRFDLATGQELNRWQLPDKAYTHHLAWHPDNRRLAVGYLQSNFVSVYDATTGAIVVHLPTSSTYQQEQSVAWHPDGVRLAVASSDPSIQIWNVPLKRKVATLDGHVQNVTAVSFHPGGELLSSTSWDGSVRIWDPSTGRQLMHLMVHAIPQFSSDGRWLGVVSQGDRAQLVEVTPPNEYRTLVSSLGAGQGGYNKNSDISADGRMLALSMNDGIRLFDLAGGRELAMLPPGRPFFQPNGELLIVGSRGLERWPLRPGTVAGELRLGPPQTIALPAVPTRAARSRDGGLMALVSESAGFGWLMDLESDSVREQRLGHDDVAFVAVSPDSRWVATGGWHSSQFRLWNAESGQMVREWSGVAYESAMPFFTPDSRTLIISMKGEFAFYDLETLEPIRPPIRHDDYQQAGHVAFSPLGGMMALELAPGVIHLKDIASARTIARLKDPRGDRSGWMSFTPDGTQLVVTANYAQAVHVWNLRTIRQRLKGMGLDMEWDDFPPATESEHPTGQGTFIAIQSGSADFHFNRGVELFNQGRRDEAIEQFRMAINIDPTHAPAYDYLGSALLDQNNLAEAITCYGKAIEIDPNRPTAHNNLGFALQMQGKFDQAIPCYQRAIALTPRYVRAHENLGWALMAQKKLGAAIESFERAIEIDPTNALGINRLAWLFVTCPQTEFRQPSEAVRLANMAVALKPHEPNYWCTLGVAHYRSDDWIAAVSALEKAQTFPGREGVSYDAFFLAMSYWRLDKREAAREWYDRAVRWIERNQENEELLRIRSEADELMMDDPDASFNPEPTATANRELRTESR
jgi:serine/threonine protein kinase/WD40 repeat protein/Flp pilus assembly protein TadD